MGHVTAAMTSLLALSVILSLDVATSNDQKLLVILLDGFRWDYLKKFDLLNLPGFQTLRDNGVMADCIHPAFPSYSFVNFYSLMTGLYAETHGQVHNAMYDPVHDTEFLAGNNPEQYDSYWWDDGEPIWITAKKQDKRSYIWYLNGCEVQIRGLRPNFCEPYQTTENPSFENFTFALNSALQVLTNGSADLAVVYMEQVDWWGHEVGPNGVEVKQAIIRVDAELFKLQDKLHKTEYYKGGKASDHVNLIVFSDHGMMERVGGAADTVSARIDVLDYISNNDFIRAMGSKSGPVLQIWPKPGLLDVLYSKLHNAHPHMTVYKKEDIPDRYHLKRHYRVPPLLLVADPGYAILKPTFKNLTYVGYHGYDNAIEDMRGIFFATGPAFKTKFRKPCFANVEIYQLMCHVLAIQPSPNNGTWNNVCDVLTHSSTCNNMADKLTTAVASTILAIILLCVAIFY